MPNSALEWVIILSRAKTEIRPRAFRLYAWRDIPVEFFKVSTPDFVFDALSALPRLGVETVPLGQAHGRALARAPLSPEDLPPGPRATMDGFAVRAEDTFGASDAIPALLRVAGEVEMGALPGFSIAAGQSGRIPTGGFLPDGADAVVMVEYTNPAGGGMVEVTRPLTAGENVIARAEDIAAGQPILPAGRRLRPHDIGLPAGLGITELTVFRRPRVAVFSTGNEIVPVTASPAPGQIRDTNTHTLRALVESAGATTVVFDVVPDNPKALRAAILRGLAEADVTALSGGSSVGERDHTAEVIAGLPGARIIAHGVAISPGKPTLVAEVGGRAVFGLPGHPVSALIVARVFLVPFLRYLEGEPLERTPGGVRIEAALSTSVHSAHGREEYVRVRVENRADGAVAVPVFGRSGLLSTLSAADGFFVVPIHAEGVPAGEKVDVFLF